MDHENREKKPGPIAELIREDEARRSQKALHVARAVLTAAMITVAYFGIIVLLMSPAFDVVPSA